MVRILSALVLMPVFGAAIWFLAPLQLLLVALGVLVVAFVEYSRLADRLGARLPRLVAGAAAAAACVGAAWPGVSAEIPMVAALIALAGQAIGDRLLGQTAFHRLGASLLGVVWLGLPLGMLVALHREAGREAVLPLLAVVIASDTAQLCVGKLFGRHRLAPTISPNKSVEGAVGGFVGGIGVMVPVGRLALPDIGGWWLAGLGAVVVASGMLGDLFESLLKRSAGVKDSSGLIPGHGGVLDRLDALLFAAPAFWIAIRYLR